MKGNSRDGGGNVGLYGVGVGKDGVRIIVGMWVSCHCADRGTAEERRMVGERCEG